MIIADATQNCYRIFQAYINGDIQDIMRENKKGFKEIDGDSMDYGDEI